MLTVEFYQKLSVWNLLITAREEAAQYKECYSRMIEVANNAVATQAELIKAHRIAREEADRLLLENTRLSRELKRRDRTVVCDWDSSKIWEISLNWLIL